MVSAQCQQTVEYNKVPDDYEYVCSELPATQAKLKSATATVARHTALQHDMSLVITQRDEAYTKVVELVRHSRLRTMSVLRTSRKHRPFRPTVLGFHSYSSLRYQRMAYYARA